MILKPVLFSPVTDAVHRSSRFFGDSKMIEGSLVLLLVLLLVSTSSGHFGRYHSFSHRRGMTATDRHWRATGSGKRTRLQGTSPGPRRICDEKEGNRKRSPVLYFYDF